MKITTTIILVGLLLLGVSAESVDANTDRIYPGQNCQPDYGASTSADLHSGGYANDASSSKLAWCPISNYRSSLLDFDAAYFHVYDSVAGQALFCQMFVRTQTGSYYIGQKVFSVDTPSDYDTLVFTGSSLPNSGALIVNAAMSSFYCSLPGEPIDGGGGYALRGYRTDTVFN